MDVLIKVYHGHGVHSDTIYAHVRNANTQELLVSATIDYCLAAIRERGWRVITS